ncbi:DUF2878 domain-containing protein [Gayadomonas joobiniege]|uniref:DUF2878 domain-containing protein n=1 Tax=Gayadomonas joobiniege TaxID=1234606 RepID=UPI00037771BD|nr:DUF2878 domain-containing protein [Gayadomonas joobiniege]
MLKPARHLILTAILFQAVWLLSAFYQNQYLWLTVPFCLIILIASPFKRDEAKLVPITSVCLLLTDVFLVCLDWIEIKSSAGFILPYWLWVIWVGFHLTIMPILSKLFASPKLAPVLFACGAAFNYWSGMKIGAITPNQPTILILAYYAVIWFLYALVLARQLKKVNQISHNTKNDDNR